MIQYAVKMPTGSWLPRDPIQRSNGLRLMRPDLWQDHSVAEMHAKEYKGTVVNFCVEPHPRLPKSAEDQ